MKIEMNGEGTWREKTKGHASGRCRCPKKKRQKVPSKEVEDDVEDRNKKKGNMSLGRKDGVIIESIYLTNIKGMTQICLAMGTKFLYK